ncbi:bacteriophage abortive infection AbiH family protein [Cohnella hongkongensis]|uniref:Bacteriophage abortive infection AbiH family protein n=1 Tax=Cohnella hongkongensis TaxID=178337 RepID=A0ABV9F762_9BACL
MKLFVIGNGFDRGHGLSTSYWNFRTYLQNMYPGFLHEFEKHYDIYPAWFDEEKQRLLWNELETNLANIDEDVIIEDALHMDLGLESGDVGILDTLDEYFENEYKYIEELARYLKLWVRTIRIRDVMPKTTMIKNENDAFYITFNYTAVLETVYKVNDNTILHIHGSLRQNDDDPILGHGNEKRINDIKGKRYDAEEIFDEKAMSICRAVENYYKRTFKNIRNYIYKLSRLSNKEVDEVIIIGHSLAGVDIPYFEEIERITQRRTTWKVYYYCDGERQRMLDSLISCGIDARRIEMIHSSEFYDV